MVMSLLVLRVLYVVFNLPQRKKTPTDHELSAIEDSSPEASDEWSQKPASV